MRRVIHKNESSDTYKWVMSYTNEWVMSHTHEWVMPRTNIRVKSHTNKSVTSHTNEPVIPHTQTNESCNTQMSETCHTYEWVVAQTGAHARRAMQDEGEARSHARSRGVMWQIWMSHVTHIWMRKLGEHLDLPQTNWANPVKWHSTRNKTALTGGVMPCIWMSHVTHVFESDHTHNMSCHTHEWVMAYTGGQVQLCDAGRRESQIKCRNRRKSELVLQPNIQLVPSCSLRQVRDVSILRVTWRIRMCDVTHSHVWHDWFIWVTWLFQIHKCFLDVHCSRCACSEDSCVTWLVHTCDMTRSYVWHDWFIWVTWLFQVLSCFLHAHRPTLWIM